MALKPATQTVKTGEQDPLIHICLVELVANFPFQGSRYDDFPGDTRMVFKPLFKSHAGV